MKTQLERAADEYAEKRIADFCKRLDGEVFFNPLAKDGIAEQFIAGVEYQQKQILEWLDKHDDRDCFTISTLRKELKELFNEVEDYI